jgi:hypothetical protein
MKRLEARELKELINKCWMTHDGMWFLHCLRECGIEKANKVNKAAIASMSAIEARRIRKAFDLGEVRSFDDVVGLVEASRQSIVADFMEFTFRVAPGDVLHFEMKSCFAHEGMKRIGAADTYECGIFHRVQGWFDALGIRYKVTPEVGTCMMITDGACYRDFTFDFPHS